MINQYKRLRSLIKVINLLYFNILSNLCNHPCMWLPPNAKLTLDVMMAVYIFRSLLLILGHSWEVPGWKRSLEPWYRSVAATHLLMFWDLVDEPSLGDNTISPIIRNSSYNSSQYTSYTLMAVWPHSAVTPSTSLQKTPAWRLESWRVTRRSRERRKKWVPYCEYNNLFLSQ